MPKSQRPVVMAKLSSSDVNTSPLTCVVMIFMFHAHIQAWHILDRHYQAPYLQKKVFLFFSTTVKNDFKIKNKK